jgi:hypothetical protein
MYAYFCLQAVTGKDRLANRYDEEDHDEPAPKTTRSKGLQLLLLQKNLRKGDDDEAAFEKKVIDPKSASVPMHVNFAYFLYVYLRISFADFGRQGSEGC